MKSRFIDEHPQVRILYIKNQIFKPFCIYR